jgi:hypothetical protein
MDSDTGGIGHVATAWLLVRYFFRQSVDEIGSLSEIKMLHVARQNPAPMAADQLALQYSSLHRCYYCR